MQLNSSHTELFALPEWPETFRNEYLRQGLWSDETFEQRIKQVCSIYGDKIAICYESKYITYQQLYFRACKIAQRFNDLNIVKGDVVILHLPNSSNYVETLFALFIAGIVPVLALPAHRRHEIEAFANATKAKAWIYQSSILGDSLDDSASHLMASIPALQCLRIPEGESVFDTLQAHKTSSDYFPVHHPDDLVCFQLSGGTTGIPKLIPRRHRDYLCNILSAVAVCDFGPKTVYLAVLPMGHNFTLVSPGILGTLFSGGRLVISDKNYPEHCFNLIKQQKVTVTALVPPLAMVWLDAAEIDPPQLESLKVLQVGGAKISYEAARRVTPLLGCSLQQVFGMAEGLNCFTQLGDSTELILYTQGKPMTVADEIKVVDENGKVVQPGSSGYLLTRGPYTIRGYYGSPEINYYSFDEDGFYRTGDIVRVTPEGYIIAEGRDKDQINRGGEKIDCGELEDILLRHPKIRDAAVVGIDDAYLGERICAFILSDSPPSDVDLRQFLIDQGIASFKIPDRFNFPETFTMTGVGKISKKGLRARLKQSYLLDMGQK
ncbi:(2,3-dihydroxybenzoyl)adenylate synthase [Citrobacter braakii]|uniref:2,3-dihydroxybenzoate-AMP ligase n=1 Tax=Citrobacter braakii TaxID=57706 RepID=A0A1V8P0Q0_CITBR|nr:AMP-binding protein [Citrobacter braakii]OQM42255.1 hypothetical protein BZK42_12075 [Citrobacter braakii]QXC16894.1 AMP-binding protein [Citrobacter braakii]